MARHGWRAISLSALSMTLMPLPFAIPLPSTATNTNSAKICVFYHAASMNPCVVHAELIATFKRAQADAAHKLGLIKTVAKKGPQAIQAAIDTAAKAEKRRDTYAKKLSALGVVLDD